MALEAPIGQVVAGHTFTVSPRYDLCESRILGKGSFGIVTTAYDGLRQTMIAIKRIRPFANDEWDARHTLREIRLMRLLAPHPNIISLYAVTIYEPKTELYLMMEVSRCCSEAYRSHSDRGSLNLTLLPPTHTHS